MLLKLASFRHYFITCIDLKKIIINKYQESFPENVRNGKTINENFTVDFCDLSYEVRLQFVFHNQFHLFVVKFCS